MPVVLDYDSARSVSNRRAWVAMALTAIPGGVVVHLLGWIAPVVGLVSIVVIGVMAAAVTAYWAVRFRLAFAVAADLLFVLVIGVPSIVIARSDYDWREVMDSLVPLALLVCGPSFLVALHVVWLSEPVRVDPAVARDGGDDVASN